MAIRAEEFLRTHLIDDEDVSSMTVPLRIEHVYHISGPAVLANEDSLLGDRTEIPAHPRRQFEKRSATDAVDALREFGLTPEDDEEFYNLDGEESYGVTYAEDISIPRGHVGIVFPTSKLVEAGGTLFTSVYTPEDSAPLEGTLRVDNDMLLKTDLRVGSLLVFETDSVSTRRLAKILKSSLANSSFSEDGGQSDTLGANSDEGDDVSTVSKELPESDATESSSESDTGIEQE